MIVVDASVLANALADDGADGARSRSALRSSTEVGIPDLADVETVAVLRKRWIAQSIDDRRLDHAMVDLGSLPVRRFPTLPLLGRAIELRLTLTVYDAVYVALAEALGSRLVTADARLARSNGPTCQIEVL